MQFLNRIPAWILAKGERDRESLRLSLELLSLVANRYESMGGLLFNIVIMNNFNKHTMD